VLKSEAGYTRAVAPYAITEKDLAIQEESIYGKVRSTHSAMSRSEK
jgi:hypothetical protein